MKFLNKRKIFTFISSFLILIQLQKSYAKDSKLKINNNHLIVDNTNTTVNNSSNYESKVSYDSIEEADEFKYFYVKNIHCTFQNCHNNSHCIDPNICKCEEGFANFETLEEPRINTFCQYKQKKQVVAFLLETFFSLGLGHFYAGRENYAIIKLLISICACLFMSVKFSEKDIVTMCLSTILSFTYLVWQIVDIINFASDNYKDGNGVPLERW
jgi:hypothetical protein